MAKQLDQLNTRLEEFISKQVIFFVGTARSEGRINVSPKGMDSLRILNPNKIIWLNLTGSGNETAAHLLENDRMTIMFCAFEGNPLILRVYGNAKIYHERDAEFTEHIKNFPHTSGARQIIEMDIDLVQTSCGFAIPLMEFKGERDTLTKWSEKKGKEGIKEYQKEKNSISLDGYDTNIV